ncbi:hypothetical protein [Rose yellow vein virus]|uniref:Transactivator/viroplasmin protein n=1 Tax=Rose yellow vein virus TaxID=1213588 RepID=I7BE86_9VIRU|nr:hypothetical protein [Rose yellow vein virus]AFO54493.1 hypothetical protein [Rose yellow vein virus]
MAIDKKAILDELEHYNVQENFEYGLIQLGYEWMSQNPHYLYNHDRHNSGICEIHRNMHLSRLGTTLKYINHDDDEIRLKAAYGMHLALAGLIESKLVFYVYNKSLKSMKEEMKAINLASSSSSSQLPKSYYAVAIGRNPGIYPTWEECKQEVHGFSNARFQKFSTLEQALEFLEDYR